VVVSERNIKLTIGYDGGKYAGWQFQPNQSTIQGHLENALKKLTSQKVKLYGAGRTDAGVHALGQVANFRTRRQWPVRKFRDGLNFYLPDDIRALEAIEVSHDFHARFDAVYRHYRYIIGLEKSAMYGGRRWEIDTDLDIQLLNDAADYILGEHDFTTCCVVSSQKEDNRCLVYTSQWRCRNLGLCYEIVADRFLHNMIRSLVGLMVELARGGMKIKRFKEIFESGDHTAIKKVAPARGLYLVDIGY
jgi:tRNA pseudouridine38-40 synthase